MISFKNKLVAIINKDIDVGVAMNSLAHATLGLGAQLSPEELRLDNYRDKNNNVYPNISQMPFIILRGKSNEIRKTITSVKEHNDIIYTVFINTMTGGTYFEQLENTKNTPEENIIYYASVIYGDWQKVTEITRKLSLYK